ncbi:MAG: GNAT family N-acetyltransferase [Candidatus Eisenbacteria bacterium]|nr:GNAT family N-acetyltransferase [Candidatus Eisenbacteria bacterium]
MPVIQSERLDLRLLTSDDAPFVLGLVNEPSWIQFIGDRGVRTVEQARAYLEKGPIAMQARFGFSFYLVELRSERVPIGICGLVKRDFLADADLGYALLPGFWGQGYAREAAAAVMQYAAQALGLRRLVAITSGDNERSIRLLAKLGFCSEGSVAYPDTGELVQLFGRELAWCGAEE